MQKLFTILLLLGFTLGLFSQSNEEKILEIVKEGVIHHDGKRYDKAIQKYKDALAIDKKSTLANYELAMTYSEIGKFKEALKFSNKVIKQNKEHMIAAYMVKGNVLDEKGKTKASIKLFKKAIAETDGHYLLNYNLGINYFKQGDIDLASQEMVKAIKQNPSHASSHLYLSLAEKRKQNTIQSLLPVYYFLLLESNSNRAKNAYKLMKENLVGDVSVDAVDRQQVNIVIDDNPDNPYTSIELMISIFSASRYTDEMKDMSNEAFFITTSSVLFDSLAEMELPKSDIWTSFYIPFFDRLSKSDHLETFCHYVMQSGSDVSTEWIAFHPDEVEEFFIWLNK